MAANNGKEEHSRLLHCRRKKSRRRRYSRKGRLRNYDVKKELTAKRPKRRGKEGVRQGSIRQKRREGCNIVRMDIRGVDLSTVKQREATGSGETMVVVRGDDEMDVKGGEEIEMESHLVSLCIKIKKTLPLIPVCPFLTLLDSLSSARNPKLIVCFEVLTMW